MSTTLHLLLAVLGLWLGLATGVLLVAYADWRRHVRRQ